MMKNEHDNVSTMSQRTMFFMLRDAPDWDDLPLSYAHHEWRHKRLRQLRARAIRPLSGEPWSWNWMKRDAFYDYYNGR